MSARSGADLVFYVTLLKMHHCAAAMNTVYDFLCRAWKRRLQESWPTGTEGEGYIVLPYQIQVLFPSGLCNVDLLLLLHCGVWEFTPLPLWSLHREQSWKEKKDIK